MGRRRVAVLALGCLVFSVVWFVRTDRQHAEPIAGVTNTAERSHSATHRHEGSPGASEESEAPKKFREVREATLIDSVTMEPAEPCVGDPVKVFTRLRPDARDAKVFVDGQPGSPQVVTALEAGRQRVRILARSWGDTFESRTEWLPVRQCDELAGVRVRAVAQLIGERRYAFRLTPRPAGSVQWDFGDGAVATGPQVVHRYEPRHDQPQSTYLVTAAISSGSARQETYVSVTHAEPTAIAARTAFPSVHNEGERFVMWNQEHGLLTERSLQNPLDEDVLFEVAEVRGYPCDGGDAQVRQAPATEVTDEPFLAANGATTASFRIPASMFAEPICEMLVELMGVAGDRITTTGFALDTGVPDSIVPVEDQATLDALAAIARSRGNGEPISAEEIAAYHANPDAY